MKVNMTEQETVGADARSSRAASVVQAGGSEGAPPRQPTKKWKIWVDLDNSPHVPFFSPIIDELRARGHELIITARDAYQTRELLEFYGVPAQIVGKHYGKLKILKVFGTLSRAFALVRFLGSARPQLSISHGSRGCLLASSFLRVPNITLIDYEFVAKIPLVRPTCVMAPSVIPDDHIKKIGTKVLKYPGIKEDVYLSRFRPDESLKTRLGIASGELVVLVRPPATEAHYHNPQSEILLREALRMLIADNRVRIVLLPRNNRQDAELRAAWADGFASGKLLIPQVENGLNLIWNSDLVISGGGTMNREAAAMGVPVYSVFRGKIGAVDYYLAEEGRLTLLESTEDVRSKIKIQSRQGMAKGSSRNYIPTLETIVDHIEAVLEDEMSSRVPAAQSGPSDT
jgi:predicted glycosyltransferase